MSLGRATALTLAVLMLSTLGLYFLTDAYRMHTACGKATAAELASFDNALGRAGRHSAPFCPKYAFTCNEMLCVEVDLPSGTPEEIRRIDPRGEGFLNINRPDQLELLEGFES